MSEGSGAPESRPPVSPTPSEELDVVIEKLVEGGDGLARVSGFPLFVPRSVPGDRLRVRVTEGRSNYARGEILEVLSPGAGRREPPCDYFGLCGGCDLQQIDDRLQPRLKAKAVMETLSRIGGLRVPESFEAVTGDAWGYRLRTGLRVERDEEQVTVGYRQRRSHDLVAVSSCPVLVPELEAQLAELPRRLRDVEAPERLDLAAGDGGEITSAPVVEGFPSGSVRRRVGEFDYSYDARCFFQGHAGLLSKFVEKVVGEESGTDAFDLFAGVGLFSLPLARRYERVVAVEGDRIAARYCRNNARTARLANVEVEATALESWAQSLPAGADRVVVDPPRAGLPGTLLRVLMGRRPRRLTYVSCHAATLARDMKRLTEGYDLEELVLLDLFPQTGHMETVAQLALRR